MCGIVGSIAERNVTPILLEGLKRLEYRGYDSSGIALIDNDSSLQRLRAAGKIKNLEAKIKDYDSKEKDGFKGKAGIAHTRWATHGAPEERNAHPHMCGDSLAVVHNGIIENFSELKNDLCNKNYVFSSETDTEVIAHCIFDQLEDSKDLFASVKKAIKNFEGAYALGVISKDDPDTLIAARKGSPLVIGVGIGEHFIASDVAALLPVTQEFIFLEDGDIARITRSEIEIIDSNGNTADRPVKKSSLSAGSAELGNYRHFMQKEIFEQPQAVIDTLEGRVTDENVLVNSFGFEAENIFKNIKQVQILACGTSYHAGFVAKYWIEDILRLPCHVEVASEYRYRNPVVAPGTLFVTISQSGETADTLAALQNIKTVRKSVEDVPTLTICNVPESSMTRECDFTFLTHAGIEIGVASTKAFTTQLVSLALLITAIGKTQGSVPLEHEKRIVNGLNKLPGLINRALSHEKDIIEIADILINKNSALFLGRGTMFPIALEGALKLKEISYIHAEAYPAGELKHGPLALIDEEMPVISVAPNNELLDKLKSNLQEVKARGGKLIIFEDERSDTKSADEDMVVVKATRNVGRITAPITFNVLLQLLAYHVAVIKGTDVDQPRNLAKSVTVE